MIAWEKIAWETKTAGKLALKPTESTALAGWFYGFWVAFPSWAGAMLAIYAIVLSASGWFKVALGRLRLQ